jgi:tRNA U34 5-carboxymethylaminomethyl modifying GTPase MnmE/TrmE
MNWHFEEAQSLLSAAIDKTGEIQAELITRAVDEIGMVLGIIGLDEIYDNVFGQLCLGK